MKHVFTQNIETERLILRRFAQGDAQAMFTNWAGDGEVTKYLMWPAHQSAAASEISEGPSVGIGSALQRKSV